MVRTFLSLLVCAVLAGCDRAPETVADAETVADPESAAAATPSARPQPSQAVMRKWSRSCALCHVDGNGGAPRLGHPEEWAARLAQGREVLLQHTIEGLNNMPPLGYCMSCERDDFVALIDVMSENR